MTPLQRYIAEEIATDHVDGLLTRREAMRRLALLGVSATAASALIASCSEKRPAPAATATASAPPQPGTAAGPPPGMDTAVPTEPITWAGPDGRQYVAIASSGGSFLDSPLTGDSLSVFALPPGEQ